MEPKEREQQKIRLDLRGRESVEFIGTVTRIRRDKGIGYADIPDVSWGSVEFEGRKHRVSQQHTPEWPSDLWCFFDPARFDSDDDEPGEDGD